MSDANSNRKVAVIGLGSMGFGMARSLLREGFRVVGCDISAENVARLVDEGGEGAPTPSEAALDADVVVCVVVNAAQTEMVLFGSGRRCRNHAGRCRLHFIGDDGSRHCPQFGQAAGDVGPILSRRSDQRRRRARSEGQLTILASGSDEAFFRARPALDAMSAKLYELGSEPGTGAAFKMINQMLAGVHIAAACEAIVFAAKQGLDLRKVYEVITASAGNSWMFENRVPHILAGDYRPLSAVEIFVKDLGIVQDMARAARYPAPVAAAALQMYLAAAGAGAGADDDFSLARVYAALSRVDLPVSAPESPGK